MARGLVHTPTLISRRSTKLLNQMCIIKTNFVDEDDDDDISSEEEDATTAEDVGISALNKKQMQPVNYEEPDDEEREMIQDHGE